MPVVVVLVQGSQVVELVVVVRVVSGVEAVVELVLEAVVVGSVDTGYWLLLVDVTDRHGGTSDDAVVEPASRVAVLVSGVSEPARGARGRGSVRGTVAVATAGPVLLRLVTTVVVVAVVVVSQGGRGPRGRVTGPGVAVRRGSSAEELLVR